MSSKAFTPIRFACSRLMFARSWSSAFARVIYSKDCCHWSPYSARIIALISPSLSVGWIASFRASHSVRRWTSAFVALQNGLPWPGRTPLTVLPVVFFRGFVGASLICICYTVSITRRECQESAKPAGCAALVNGTDITGNTASLSKLNSCKHPRICFNLALVWVAMLKTVKGFNVARAFHPRTAANSRVRADPGPVPRPRRGQ